MQAVPSFTLLKDLEFAMCRINPPIVVQHANRALTPWAQAGLSWIHANESAIIIDFTRSIPGSSTPPSTPCLETKIDALLSPKLNPLEGPTM
jgi:hypothetical protein